MKHIFIFLIILISFSILDSLWLGVVAKKFYQKHLGRFFASKFKFWPALIFYPLYGFGVFMFVIKPALDNSTSLLSVFLLGALFGIIAYATYNLTNLVTLKDWPIKSVLVDIAWGGFVTGAVSVISFLIVK